MLIILSYIKNITNNGRYEEWKSSIDNKKYKIRNGLYKSNEYKLQSANTLAILNRNIEKLIDYLDKNENDIFVKYLKRNYNANILSEAIKSDNWTTYTLNKESIYMCIRTKDENDDIYDINLLMFVLLHELAHLSNYDSNGFPIIGHGKEFKDIFTKLVETAIKINIYIYEDYKKSPKEYCGIEINSNII
jgi:predicted metal-dependent hydrolase